MRTYRASSELVGSQWDFIQDDVTKFLHLSAGYGFGKTRTLCYKLLDLSRKNYPYAGGLVVPSYTEFSRDVKLAMEEILDSNKIRFKYHGGEHWYKFPWTPGKLYVATAEKKIRGPNWAYAGINELTMISLERYREVAGRVRLKGAKNPQIASSGTPEGIASEYYEIFVEKPWKNSKCLYGDTRDNAHNLEPSFIQAIFDSYPAALADAYIRGLWVNMAGNRFYFSYDPKINDKANEIDPNEMFHISMDLNVDPFCTAIWQLRGNKLVNVDEVVLEGGAGYKTENMLNALMARGYGPANSYIYPDPASKARNTRGAPDAEVMRNTGYEVRIKNVAPRFRERQINVNNRFDKLMVEIHPTKSPKLKKDLLAVETDPITGEKIKKNPKLTHSSDGMDYMIDILMPFSSHRSGISTGQLR